jgi:Cu(I)/Ag(I) efflux system membrane protein CusA/SilA
MIDRLIDASIRHRFAVLIIAGAAGIAGWQSMRRLPLDALPDIGDRQVVVYSQWERSPEAVDAQVTQAIVAALLGAPHVKTVRGISDVGASWVYVIFDDDTDLYWARARTLECLSRVTARLPEGVRPELGPDTSALGWVFQYVLVDRSRTHSAAELRAYQDWHLRYDLEGIPGVAEVATVGGIPGQYQVEVDPNRLRGYGISIQHVVDALKTGNRDGGGQVLPGGGAEFVIRSLSSAQSIGDLEDVVVATAAGGTPVRIRDVAHVTIGSVTQRGAVDFDGNGNVVSGIVVMRAGENALEVIERVKAKIRSVQASLPNGVEVVPVYDRSDLIRRSIDSLERTILEVMATVAIVILVFLSHFPSVAVPLIVLPLSVLIAFIPFRFFGVGADIMSLTGIAMAVGALVDAGIILVEQTHKRLAEWENTGRQEDPQILVVCAIKQVARPGFFALMVIAVSFLPVLALQGEEGRLFTPLVYAKSLAVIVAAILTVTLAPALRVVLIRASRFRFHSGWARTLADAILVGRIRDEGRHPLTRRITRLYEPAVEWSLEHKRVVIGVVLVLLAATVPVALSLETELMPPMDEGALLYMPTTMPGISIAEAERLLQITDRTLRRFPEVDHVLGKAGHAATATDPAPLSMLETVIVLRPSSEWRHRPTWYSSWAPGWATGIFRRLTPDHISMDELVAQMNDALKIPGVSNAWSMPVRARIDMLTTGVRTPLGLKITGDNIEEIERVGADVAAVLPSIEGTRSVFVERAGQGRFLDIKWNRLALARAGVSIDDAQRAVQYAVAGETVTSIVRERERYPVNVRYAGDAPPALDAVGAAVVTSNDGRRQIQLAELADIRTRSGPTMLRNDNGSLAGYVFVDITGDDYGRFIGNAGRRIRDAVKVPTGYSVSWTGRYETIATTHRRLLEVVPSTLGLIFLLLYVSTQSLSRSLLVLLAVPLSAIGAIWTVYLLGYHLSVAVWVGLMTLMGVDAETGIFMVLYLDDALDRAREARRLNSPFDLREAVIQGAARRVRPKFMTVATMFVGLLPIMWSTGAASEVMKRIAAPMVGGILTSFVLELLLYPVIYYSWKSRSLPQSASQYPASPALPGSGALASGTREPISG